MRNSSVSSWNSISNNNLNNHQKGRQKDKNSKYNKILRTRSLSIGFYFCAETYLMMKNSPTSELGNSYGEVKYLPRCLGQDSKYKTEKEISTKIESTKSAVAFEDFSQEYQSEFFPFVNFRRKWQNWCIFFVTIFWVTFLDRRLQNSSSYF